MSWLIALDVSDDALFEDFAFDPDVSDDALFEDFAFDPDASDDLDTIDADALSSFCSPFSPGDTVSPISAYLHLLEMEPDGVGRLT